MKQATPKRAPASATAASPATAERPASPMVAQLKQMGSYAAQASALEPTAPAERPLAPTGAGTALPGPVQAKMSEAFGADFSGVQVHTDSADASAMGADAFAEGENIHFAAGKYQPESQSGQELVGHELAHVVQQRQGRVKPQAKGGLNTDPGLEREADAAGARAARGESVGALSGVGGTSDGPAVQCKFPTKSGTFDAPTYAPIVQDGKSVGMDVHLEFEPGTGVDASKIALMQTVRSTDEGKPNAVNPASGPRRVKSGDAAGFELDRAHGNNNPVYGAEPNKTGKIADTPMSSAGKGKTPSVGYGAKDNTTYKLGFRHQPAGQGWATENAELVDRPKLPSRGANAGQEFETTAVAIDGNQSGTYYGSISWGWKTDGAGKFSPIPVTVASVGNPTKKFSEAAALWNTHKFSSILSKPDAKGNTALTANAEMTSDGGFMTLGAGTTLNLSPTAPEVGAESLVTLGATIRVVDGGSYWIFFVPNTTVINGDRLAADTVASTAGNTNTFTVKANSKIKSQQAVGQRTMIVLDNGLITKSANPIIAWINTVDAKGGDTVDAPLPAK